MIEYTRKDVENALKHLDDRFNRANFYNDRHDAEVVRAMQADLDAAHDALRDIAESEQRDHRGNIMKGAAARRVMRFKAKQTLARLARWR